jgi:hypothetical protein
MRKEGEEGIVKEAEIDWEGILGKEMRRGDKKRRREWDVGEG